MEPNPQYQSSFIPKKPVTVGSFSRHSVGLFPFIANIIFVIALMATLLVFVYSKYLEGSISKMETKLTEARISLDPNLINQLYRSDLRIVSSKELVQKHISLSSFFELLQIKVLQNVSFSSFSFNSNDGGSITLLMKGNAKNYATLALQAKEFEQDDNFINPIFSDLTLNDRGEVVFVFKSHLNAKAVSYLTHFGDTPRTGRIQPVMTGQVEVEPTVNVPELDPNTNP